MAKILGIDLGTTNSCVAVVLGAEPVVIANSEAARTTPSIVAFTKGGERLVGAAAKRQAVTNAQNTVFSIKRFMGRKYEEVQDEAKRVPYRIVKAPNGDAHVEVEVAGDRKTFSPPEISAMILGKLKSAAESWLDERIAQAVITVPASFNDSQRNATKEAGWIAGLEVLQIINEPAAASLAYGLNKKKGDKIAVYGLGGGTFDISVLEVGEDVFELKANNGDIHLGGDDWDKCLMDWIIAEFRRDTGLDLSKQPDPLQRIKEEAEKAKIALSSLQEYEINLRFIIADATRPKHLQKRLTRARLEQLTDELLERTTRPVKACLADAGLSESQINELVLAGGMTGMPKVIQMARRLTGKEPHKGINPDEVVAVGAAIRAAILRSEVKDVLLLDAPTAEPTGFDTALGIDLGKESRGITESRREEPCELPAPAPPPRSHAPAQAEQGPPAEANGKERPARYADFAFFGQTPSGKQGGLIAPQAPLMANAKYQLEVSIKSKTVGIRSSAERVTISEPGQNYAVGILVIADSEDFEIPEPVQKLILPPTGDSVENASFRNVRPIRRTNTEADLAQIRVRLYYNLNLMESVLISAEVVSPLEDASRSRLGLDDPISLMQQVQDRDYRNFDLVLPRAMHILVTRGSGSFELTFTLQKEGGREIALTGSSRIPEASLEDSLVSIRKTLLGISVWNVFASAVECRDLELFSKGMLDLARQGRKLWTKIFEIERGSSLYVIGEWLRTHPLPAGSLIQISVDRPASAFILPWNLLYDRDVPVDTQRPIASDGFWGLRYQIEQRSEVAHDHYDEPVAASGPLDIGFLRSPIAEAALHLKALQGLVEESRGRIATVNPIESAKEAFRYLEECPSHIVSFFAHGHTKFAESARTGFTEEDFVSLYEDTSDPSLREAWKELYDEIKARQYQSDSSWIKLRYGKLYLLELYQKIEEFKTGPVVLLNMCESAQLTPSLQESFIHFFLDRGARAVLGTECSMRPLFAHHFAQQIMESLVFGDTIGQALLKARKDFVLRGNPLGLAYTLFGSPTIRFQPPPIERSAAEAQPEAGGVRS